MTQADLRVNGQTYTGLTTLILNQPKEKYRARMLELASSQNKTVRSAAVRNLLIIGQEKGGEDIVKALLPWLTNANWVDVADDERGRGTLVGWLSQYRIPEAVPGLIALLDEKEEAQPIPPYRPNANANTVRTMSNASSSSDDEAEYQVYTSNMAANVVSPSSRAYNAAANAANTAAYAANRVYGNQVSYPHRQSAVSALAFQKDPRAIPPLRRLLGQVSEQWERGNLIKAIVSVGGFSIAEQVDGLEAFVKATADLQARFNEAVRRAEYNASVVVTNANVMGSWATMADAALDVHIGQAISMTSEPGEALIKAVIDRIAAREKNDPATARMLKEVLLKWKSPAVNALMLRELKEGKATQESVVRLLALRKEIRETQVGNVLEAGSGNPTASAISACMMDDSATLTGLLNANAEAAAAALACSRLLRIPLPIEPVIPMMHGGDKRLALAAEKYLESEDSHEARMAVLSLYPGQAKILGAAPNFLGTKPASQMPIDVETLQNAGMIARASNYAAYLPQAYEEIRQFFDKEPDLAAVYFYQESLIRIYSGGRVTFSIFEDDKRYRERELTKEEFDEIRQYIAETSADRLPPFLDGCVYDCEYRTLVLAGRNGGRIVFGAQKKLHEFFLGLDRYFEGLAGQAPMRTRYLADLDIPGLEVVFAVDGLSAETVWKDGDDLRALIVDAKARERIISEVNSTIESESEASDEEDSVEPREEYYQRYEKRQKELERRNFEGIGWFSIANGELGRQTTAPQGIELPPVKDAFSVPAEVERWRVTAGQVELRIDEQALYRVTQGKLTKIRDGSYLSVAISSDGKWAVATKYTVEYDIVPVRINLACLLYTSPSPRDSA
ncbi:MAG: hypothetical protein QUS14_10480, partial [Pyrinomonadaceae bacterium]|nr:hypothetical protein [Pyrinomonadaceae bacterium]